MSQKFISQEQFAQLLERYLQGKCRPEEEKMVMDWYEATGSDRPFQLSDSEIEEVESRMRGNLQTAIGKERWKKGRSLTWVNWRTASVAAAITLLIASIGVIYQFKTNNALGSLMETTADLNGISTFTNNKDIAEQYTLEDGTVITLQPNSTLSFSKPFAQEQREVNLIGEGFFEVKTDEKRPFLVYTGKVVTKVLGTSFNITAKASKDIVVAVRTGKVSVARQESSFLGLAKSLKDEVILTPNEQAVYNAKKNSIEATLVEAPAIISTHQELKTMKFDNAPLTEIFTTLATAYQVEIVFDANQLKECTLTTTLNKENLFERLNIICKAIGGSYAKEGTKIIIHNDGCK